MKEISNSKLVALAKSVLRPARIGGYLVGDASCALSTDKGNVYLGVCIDAPSGMGFCAEHSAIAAMVTARECRISKLVGICTHKGKTYVLSPCGRCRQLIKHLHKENLNAKIILGKDRSARLSELLPCHDLFERI